jgi:hypothetical protein
VCNTQYNFINTEVGLTLSCDFKESTFYLMNRYVPVTLVCAGNQGQSTGLLSTRPRNGPDVWAWFRSGAVRV